MQQQGTLRNGWQKTLDFRLDKHQNIGGNRSFDVMLDVFNIFQRQHNRSSAESQHGAVEFHETGQIMTPRAARFGARFNFWYRYPLADREFLEDYSVGEVLISPSRTMTESDVLAFAGLTGDWHPLHTDAVFASQSMFGRRIIHGMLTLAVGSTFVLRLGPYRVYPKEFHRVLWHRKRSLRPPGFLGDTIHSVNAWKHW